MDFFWGDKFQMLKWFRKEFPNIISKRTLPMASTGSSPMSACSLSPCTSRTTCFCCRVRMHTCRSWFQMCLANSLLFLPCSGIKLQFASYLHEISEVLLLERQIGLLECLSSTIVYLSGTWKRCYLLKIPILFSSWPSIATLS